jgi:hypothetical protein
MFVIRTARFPLAKLTATLELGGLPEALQTMLQRAVEDTPDLANGRPGGRESAAQGSRSSGGKGPTSVDRELDSRRVSLDISIATASGPQAASYVAQAVARHRCLRPLTLVARSCLKVRLVISYGNGRVPGTSYSSTSLHVGGFREATLQIESWPTSQGVR